LVLHTWTGDIYVHMHHTESMYNSLVQALLDAKVPPEDLMLTVEIVPMVHLVWAGVALMGTAAAMSLAKELLPPIRKKAHAGSRRNSLDPPASLASTSSPTRWMNSYESEQKDSG
jgi:hypothetical protein